MERPFSYIQKRDYQFFFVLKLFSRNESEDGEQLQKECFPFVFRAHHRKHLLRTLDFVGKICRERFFESNK
jgi:hypothetical protein